ncbi:hypothetical protein Acr_27g0002130 [Actinidia rufa]|uniref:Putative plant transposon protein domain-containing protein n=1 Tax=Actinidia rufa TaxID=165716 RepID=A0A7J0H6T7_9ERIC|nr:hypothetical protein Acr_27g0002130 [Actinidia rufa]
MVNTKHTVNDPKGDIGTSNLRQSAFRRRKFFKNERIQDIWPDFQNRNIITGRNIEDGFKPKYRQKMMEPVRALGWSALIPLPTSVYSDLVRYFYCNLEVGNLDKPEFSIDSYVRGKHIELNPTILSQIIGVPNEGELIFLDRPSQLKNHVNRAEMNEIVSIRGTVGASHHKDLKKEYRLFHKFIAYNVVPQHGHYNQVSTMDNFIIYRSATNDPLNLNYIILREMAYIRNHKKRSLPYGALLTKVFEHFGVSFRNQHDQHIDEGFSNYTISRGISVDSTDKEDDIDIPPQILGDINMDDVSLDDDLPQSPHPQEGQTSREGPPDCIEQRQILNDKLHELHGTYIDRLGDNYEQLYIQQTKFHQECLDRLKAVQTLVEAESHFQYDPPPFSPHSQALMNLKGTKRSNNF